MQSVYATIKQSFQTYRRITYKNTYENIISMYFLFIYEYDTVLQLNTDYVSHT